MRFTRITPESPDDLRNAILQDLDSLAPGMRSVATRVPVAGRGVIDLLASDERGRLAVVSFCLDADPASVARAVDQWDWTVANMGLLRALVPVVGLDLSLSPRAMLVCRSIDENVRRFAACLPTPGVEIFEAAMVAAGDQRGLLVDRVDSALRTGATTGSSIEAALEGIASDEIRALTRRLLEGLAGTTEGGGPFSAVRLMGAFDIRRDGREIASLAATAEGLAVRWFDSADVMRVSDDDDCREAVRLLGEPLDEDMPVARAPVGGSSGKPSTAALTAEEVAEFERLRSDPQTLQDAAAAEPGPGTAPTPSKPDARLDLDTSEPPAVRVLRTGFMEN